MLVANYTPVVSVIIPLFNRKDLITKTLNSLINQSYPLWEAVIVDDGSTDGSLELVSQFCNDDQRINIIKRNKMPKGAPTCRNVGIGHALGKYLIFLDSDDLLATFCLKRRVELFEKYNEYDFLVFPMLIFYDKPEHGHLLWNKLNSDKNDIDRFLSTESPWQTTCPIWKKKAIENNSLYWNEYYTSRQDLEYHIRALALGMSYRKFDEVYDCYYRMGRGDQISSTDFFLKEKIESKNRVFHDISKMLYEKKLLNLHRRRMLGELFLENLNSNFTYSMNINPTNIFIVSRKYRLFSTYQYIQIFTVFYTLFYLEKMFSSGRKLSMFLYGRFFKKLIERIFSKGRYNRYKPITKKMKSLHNDLVVK